MSPLALPADFLRKGEFVVLKNQTISGVHTEGEQGNGNFGNDSGIVILDEGIVTPDVNDGAEHFVLLLENRPGLTGRALVCLEDVRN